MRRRRCAARRPTSRSRCRSVCRRTTGITSWPSDQQLLGQGRTDEPTGSGDRDTHAVTIRPDRTARTTAQDFSGLDQPAEPPCRAQTPTTVSGCSRSRIRFIDRRRHGWRSRWIARRHRGARKVGRSVDRRRRCGGRAGEHEGRRRGGRRYGGHPGLRARTGSRPRAADHQEDRHRVTAQQVVADPSDRAAPQRDRTDAGRDHPDGRRQLPLFRGRREDLPPVETRRQPRRPRRGPGAAGRAGDHQGRDPHRPHPVGRDHGHRPEGGDRRRPRATGHHPDRRRPRHHRDRLRRGRSDREDGRHRPRARRADISERRRRSAEQWSPACPSC